MEPHHVILDVDAGGDDALAIFLFLFAEVLGFVRILAITCVRGNTELDNVVVNVYRILEAANRTDIPVYKGAHSPIIPPDKSGDGFFGKDGFGDLQWATKPNLRDIKTQHAAIAIGELIAERPGKISVIALAPLTNIALTTKLYKNFMRDVKSIYIMGGNYLAIGNIVPAAEFNFYIDPESAFVVFNNTLRPLHILPWEALLATNISIDWRFDYLARMRNPVLDVIERSERTVYPSKAKNYGPIDAFLAAAYLFPEDIVKKESIYYSTVELHGKETRGQVVVHRNSNETANTIFIESINQEKFKSLLLVAAEKTKKSFKRRF